MVGLPFYLRVILYATFVIGGAIAKVLSISTSPTWRTPPIAGVVVSV